MTAEQPDVAELLVRCLQSEGVSVVFGIPGEENIHLTDALARSPIRYVLVRHEQAASFMAEIYGRLTGRAGVCSATLGPGAINLLLPRGSGPRTPWVYDVDGNVSYRLGIDKDKSLAVTVDIFNLLNFQQYTSIQEQYTTQAAVGQQGGPLTAARVQPGGFGTAFRQIQASDRDPNFGLPASYQTPRYFRFGIRGTF